MGTNEGKFLLLFPEIGMRVTPFVQSPIDQNGWLQIRCTDEVSEVTDDWVNRIWMRPNHRLN